MIITVNQTNILEAAFIHSESWKESHRDFCTTEFINLHTVLHQKAYLENEMKNGKMLFMLIDQVPVGIVSVYGSLIENLYILPTKQRKGYGSKLLQFAIKRCTDTPCLWILSSNYKAYSLYSKYGFKVTGNEHKLTDDISEIEMSYTE